MVRAAIVSGLCLGLLGGAVSLAVAQDFSANVYNINGKEATKSGKVYVKGTKMRIDRGDASADGSTPLVLVDLDSHSATIFDAGNHAYMKTEVGADQGLSFFHVKNPNDACAEFAKMINMSGCKKAGNETVDGRQTVKYAGKSNDEKAIAMWVDPGVSFVVKWQTNSGEVGELRDIQAGTQDDTLFAIPAGYHDALKGSEGSADEQGTKSDSDKKEEPPATKEEPKTPPQ